MSAYDDGYAAYFAMKSRSAVPEHLSDEEKQEWLAGYEYGLLYDGCCYEAYYEES